MAKLTEDKIKLACLRFLKNHYKFRPRIGPATAQTDMRSEEGIVADGHLFFVTEDGHQFLATFEATSDQIFEEVKFKQENRILFWDSLAAAFIIATLTFTYGYIWDKFAVKDVGWKTTLTVVFLAGVLGFWVYKNLVKRRHRYRYIYAIEQFKRYHADEQWIAIADTIFPNSEDIYYDELKRQCVDNGIGLLTVSKEEEVHLVVTPARQDVFQNKRAIIHFVNQEIKKGKTWGRRLSDRGRNILDVIFGRSKNSNSLHRYRRSFYKQILTVILCLGFMSFILFREFQDLPISYVNKKEFAKDVQKKLDTTDQETLEYLIDTSSLVAPAPGTESYLSLAAAERALRPAETPFFQEKWKINPKPEEIDNDLPNLEGNAYVSYNCARLFNFEKRLFLIKYTLLPDYDLAQQEVQRLAKKGVEANILWLGCFLDQEMSYALYFDLFYLDKLEAEQALKKFREELENAKLDAYSLSLVEVIK